MTNIFITVLSLVLFVFFFFGLLFVKKKENKINVLIWLPITAFLSVILVEFGMAVICLTGAPANIFTASMVCLMLGAVCWYFIKKRGFQKFLFDKTDLVPYFLITAITVFFALNQFGVELYPLYETSDPSIHLQSAMKVFTTSKIDGMFFSALFNSNAISFFSPFVSQISYYKVFILTDILMFWLSGLIFYSVMADRTESKTKKIIAAILACFYIIGYPLNNMVFGFVYLGMGISVAMLILFFGKRYNDETTNSFFVRIALMTSCFCLAICYSLFAPIMYVGLFLTVAIPFFKSHKIFSLKFIMDELRLFLIPCILAILYIYFLSDAPEIKELAKEGYIFRELYSNFIFLIAPVIYGIMKTVLKKKTEISVITFFVILLYAVVTLILCLNGAISTYYFYKIYYLLWPICFYITFIAIDYSEKSDVKPAICYGLSFVTVFSIYIFRFENTLNRQNQNLVYNIRSDDLFSIYEFNFQKVLFDDDETAKADWDSKLQLCRYVIDNFRSENETVPIIAEWDVQYWFEAVTNQYQLKEFEDEQMLSVAKESKYVAVIGESETFNNNKRYLNRLKKVFENECGFVACIN